MNARLIREEAERLSQPGNPKAAKEALDAATSIANALETYEGGGRFGYFAPFFNTHRIASQGNRKNKLMTSLCNPIPQ